VAELVEWNLGQKFKPFPFIIGWTSIKDRPAHLNQQQNFVQFGVNATPLHLEWKPGPGKVSTGFFIGPSRFPTQKWRFCFSRSTLHGP
jgi:hypothetical protein